MAVGADGLKKGCRLKNLNFNIHGVRLHCAVDVPAAAAALEDRLTPYLVDGIEDVEIKMAIARPPEDLKTFSEGIPKDLTWVRSRPYWGSFQGDVLQVTDGASVCAIDYRAREARLFVSDETVADSHFLARTFLLLPVAELLRTQGLYFVHGALVKRDNDGVLILGRGGSGKSTLTAAFLRKGYRLVADDNLLLGLNAEGQCEAYALEQELSLSGSAFRDLTLDATPSLERGKLRIRATDLPATARAESATPSVVLHLLDGSTSADLFAALVRENPLVLAVPFLAEAHVRALKQLLRQCRRLGWQPPRLDPLDLDLLGNQAIAAIR